MISDAIQDAAEHLAKACDGIERNGLSGGQTVERDGAIAEQGGERD